MTIGGDECFRSAVDVSLNTVLRWSAYCVLFKELPFNERDVITWEFITHATAVREASLLVVEAIELCLWMWREIYQHYSLYNRLTLSVSAGMNGPDASACQSWTNSQPERNNIVLIEFGVSDNVILYYITLYFTGERWTIEHATWK